MSTPRINYDAPLTRVVVASRALAADPFVLVDVGASGGIEQQWRQFEPHLRSYGFDPLVKEVQRLNREEKNGNIRYFDAFVGAERYAEVFPAQVENDPVAGWSNRPAPRTSATRAQKFQPITEQQRFNNDLEIILSGNRISLDVFFADRPEANVDFIKIDTDGYDYEVLFGADKVVRERGVLGFFVESQFHGVTHPHSNLYANIDRYMRERGFSLFDLETYRYTRGVLPGHFVYQLAAQTHEGQVVWGDALFLRDVSAPGYDARWSLTLPPAKLLKLACLYEIFGMPDCAAELLVQRRDVLEKYLDVPAALDILTREIDPEAESFDRHNERFDRGPELFYPVAMPTETERLRREIDQLQQTLARYRADTTYLEGVIAEMQSSRFWKLRLAVVGLMRALRIRPG